MTLASIGDGVITTDEAGIVQYLNPVAERLTGWPAHQARGQPVTTVFRLLDADSGEPLPNPVRELLRGTNTRCCCGATASACRSSTPPPPSARARAS